VALLPTNQLTIVDNKQASPGTYTATLTCVLVLNGVSVNFSRSLSLTVTSPTANGTMTVGATAFSVNLGQQGIVDLSAPSVSTLGYGNTGVILVPYAINTTAFLHTTAVSSNISLSGSYYFRHVLMVTNGAAGISEMRSGAGTMIFDGVGGFSYTGQQIVGTSAPTALTGSGTYTVKSGGFATITNPLRANTTINARLGKGALMGASTEAGATVFDLFIAIPVTAQTLSNATLNGAYTISSLEFPGASLTNIRETQFKATANGAGAIAETSVSGQARNLNNQYLTQTVPTMTYSVAGNGTGSLTIPAGGGQSETSQLITGAKTIYVSQDGTVFIGGSLTAGLHGIVVGMKSYAGSATNASWTGAFYNAGIRFDADRSRLAAVTAGVNVTAAGAVFGRRTRQTDGLFDAATLATYQLESNGSGQFTSTVGQVSVASSGEAFSTTGTSFTGSPTYELSFGARMIPESGTGVFVQAQGVLNAASFATGYPIAPGSFVALFGNGLASQNATATTIPFPTLLANVRITVNNLPAPLYVVTPTFISFIVPYGVTGPTATIVVTSNGVASNAVEVPLSPSAPGIFSILQNGLGDGAVRHGNATIVSASNPAKPGEFLEVYLTGLGLTTPTPLDGAGAPLAEPLARFTAPLVVTIGGISCEVAFAGLTPGLAGLYQINIKTPAGLAPGSYSLAIQTVEGFTDMVNISIGQ
jgi:uncharacterized protein (TIGR03437 family)